MCVYRQGTMLIPDIVHRAFMTHYKFAVTVACIVLREDRKYQRALCAHVAHDVVHDDRAFEETLILTVTVHIGSIT